MARHHPDLIMCRKQPGIAVGRLCEKCKWMTASSPLAASAPRASPLHQCRFCRLPPLRRLPPCRCCYLSTFLAAQAKSAAAERAGKLHRASLPALKHNHLTAAGPLPPPLHVCRRRQVPHLRQLRAACHAGTHLRRVQLRILRGALRRLRRHRCV